MKEKLYSKIDTVVIDGSIGTFDASAMTAEVISCDTSDIQASLDIILEKQKTSRVLVVTESSDICNILLALNSAFKKNKLSVLCAGSLCADEALKELEREENMLYTENGAEYYPETQVDEMLFATEDGMLLLMNGNTSDERRLYSSDNTCWGAVLDPAVYTINSLVGSVKSSCCNLSVCDKTVIAQQMLQLFENGSLCDFHNLLIFRNEDGCRLLPAASSAVSDFKKLISALYELFFDHAMSCRDKLMGLIEDRLSHPEYPAYIFEDFETAYADTIYPGIDCNSLSMTRLANTFTRMAFVTAGQED